MRALSALFVLSMAMAALGQATYSVPEIAAKVLPLLVMISSPEGQGSGIAISDNGLVLTNWHVIDPYETDAAAFSIKTHDGRTRTVDSIVAFDPDADLAVIQVHGFAPGKPISIADTTTIVVGEDVVAIGNPLGISEIVTRGIIEKYTPLYVYTSASISPGNSGGPLVDVHCKIVGINTYTKLRGQNINMAVAPRAIAFFLKSHGIALP